MSETTAETVEQTLSCLLSKREDIRKTLGQVDEDIAACQKVIALIRAPNGPIEASDEAVTRPSLSKGTAVTADDLRGSDIESALIRIAEVDQGVLLSYRARPVLMEAGIFRGDQRSASSRLYEALTRSECFERLPKRGRWRLIPEKVAERERMEELGKQPTVF